MITPGDFWLSSGHQLCDRDEAGRLVPTPDLWRAFLARPELVPPPEACEAERALHAGLLAAPLRPVPAAGIAALADADARENWGSSWRSATGSRPSRPWRPPGWRCSAAASPASRRCSCRCSPISSPGRRWRVGDAFTLRAAEAFFRPQRAAIHPGALLLADEEFLDARAGEADLGTLGRLLAEAGRRRARSSWRCCPEANAPGYRGALRRA